MCLPSSLLKAESTAWLRRQRRAKSPVWGCARGVSRSCPTAGGGREGSRRLGAAGRNPQTHCGDSELLESFRGWTRLCPRPCPKAAAERRLCGEGQLCPLAGSCFLWRTTTHSPVPPAQLSSHSEQREGKCHPCAMVQCHAPHTGSGSRAASEGKTPSERHPALCCTLPRAQQHLLGLGARIGSGMQGPVPHQQTLGEWSSPRTRVPGAVPAACPYPWMGTLLHALHPALSWGKLPASPLSCRAGRCGAAQDEAVGASNHTAGLVPSVLCFAKRETMLCTALPLPPALRQSAQHKTLQSVRL